MLDTNILVYALGMHADGSKNGPRWPGVEEYYSQGYLTAQGLAEFVNVALRHGKDPDWTVRQVQQQPVAAATCVAREQG